MTQSQIETRVAQMVDGQVVSSFRQRMALQMQVIDTLSREWHISDMDATMMIAPVFAKFVPHVN